MDRFLRFPWQFVEESFCELKNIVADTRGDSMALDVKEAHIRTGIVYFVCDCLAVGECGE